MNGDIWQKEPALITAFVTAIIVLAVTFGVPISEEQKNAILGVLSALLMLGGAVAVRNTVYSPNTVETEVKPAAFIQGVIAGKNGETVPGQ